jgi:hypothetical protein
LSPKDIKWIVDQMQEIMENIENVEENIKLLNNNANKQDMKLYITIGIILALLLLLTAGLSGYIPALSNIYCPTLTTELKEVKSEIIIMRSNITSLENNKIKQDSTISTQNAKIEDQDNTIFAQKTKIETQNEHILKLTQDKTDLIENNNKHQNTIKNLYLNDHTNHISIKG